MRLLLIMIGALFAAGALLVVGQLVASEFPIFLGFWWGTRAIRVLVFVGLPALVSAFFFRWAWNMRGTDA